MHTCMICHMYDNMKTYHIMLKGCVCLSSSDPQKRFTKETRILPATRTHIMMKGCVCVRLWMFPYACVRALFHSSRIP